MSALVTDAYCGLYCESCLLYIATKYQPERLVQLAAKYGKSAEELQCNGCRSDKLSFYCVTCKIKECIKQKGLNMCGDCSEYPCGILTEFQSKMPHRLELFKSLDYCKEHGLESWRQKMIEDYSCACGTINTPYDFKCRNCGKYPSSEFVKRNAEEILKQMKTTTK